MFFCDYHVFLIYTIFQRSEIICLLADLLTDRKEEILAANKVDMEQAVNEGRITRKKRNELLRLKKEKKRNSFCFDFTIREEKDPTLIANRENTQTVFLFSPNSQEGESEHIEEAKFCI